MSNFAYIKVSSNMAERRDKIIGFSRHRLSTDGDGITTLVAFHGSSTKKGCK